MMVYFQFKMHQYIKFLSQYFNVLAKGQYQQKLDLIQSPRSVIELNNNIHFFYS